MIILKSTDVIMMRAAFKFWSKTLSYIVQHFLSNIYPDGCNVITEISRGARALIKACVIRVIVRGRIVCIVLREFL